VDSGSALHKADNGLGNAFNETEGNWGGRAENRRYKKRQNGVRHFGTNIREKAYPAKVPNLFWQ
jgi:hypothetical protein